MSSRRQISCINRQDRHNPHERIINIGGIFAGERWKFSQTEAVAHTERGVYSFFIRIGKSTLDVIISTYMGNKYLKTQTDENDKDNLFSLPECPPD